MSDQEPFVIETCRWRHNKKSPVLLMIDDLCNTWVDTDGDGKAGPGEDWGAMGMKPGSAVEYLLNGILSRYPAVKTTFLVPVGVRVGVIRKSPIPVYSQPMDADPFIRDFFKSLHGDSRFELAYHGTHHGIPGDCAEDFIHEWRTYKNLDEALRTIEQGREIFYNAVGAYPVGGKYCGYHINEFSDQSIDLSGFAWWCKNSAGDPLKHSMDPTIVDMDDTPDISYFGSRQVVNIPDTLGGSLFNEVWRPSGRSPVKRGIKSLLKTHYITRAVKELKNLVDQGSVVSISEHIAPSRNDGRIQMPNIYTDQKSLLTIFEYVSGKPVWYCTGKELEAYVRARDFSQIEAAEAGTFQLTVKDSRIIGNTLSLKISGNHSHVLQPDGSQVPIADGIADIRVQAGTYHVKAEG